MDDHAMFRAGVRAEDTDRDRMLRGLQGSGLLARQVGREDIVYVGGVDVEESRGIGPECRIERRCRELRANGLERFVRVRRKGGDVDERLHLGIARRGTADHRSAVRVANEHDVPRLRVDEARSKRSKMRR